MVVRAKLTVFIVNDDSCSSVMNISGGTAPIPRIAPLSTLCMGPLPFPECVMIELTLNK